MIDFMANGNVMTALDMLGPSSNGHDKCQALESPRDVLYL